VPPAAPSTRNSPVPDPASVTALAEQTGTPEDVAKQIYDEEIAALYARSTVKNFVAVIARRRARQRLSALKARAPRSHDSSPGLADDQGDSLSEPIQRRQRRARS
jgi:hypothetical protein